MKLLIDNDWLRRKIASDPDEPEGCPACGAIAGACDKYPNCPGGRQETSVSYSFSAKGTTKQDAITAAKAEMDKVVEAQPVHAADAPVVADTVAAMVGLLQEDTTKDVLVNVNGYVMWNGTDAAKSLTSASVTVSASLQLAEAAAAA